MNRRSVLAGTVAAVIAPAHVLGTDHDEVNTAVLRGYVNDVLNARDLAAVRRYVAPDFAPVNPDHEPGRDALIARLAQGFETFPDLVYHLDAAVEDAADVMARGTIAGTSNGVGFSLGWATHVTIRDGKIVSAWMLTGSF